MRSDILILLLHDGTLFVGPPHSLDAIAGAFPIDVGPYRSRLRELLTSRADPWDMRNAVVVWRVEEFDSRQRAEQRLHDQIARMVETGRLAARFLPLFLDDPRRPGEVGPLRIYRLGYGPKARAPDSQRPAAAARRPQPILAKSAVTIEKDFPDEDAQIAVLRAAAKDGTPFCEQCERARLRGERAAHDAA